MMMGRREARARVLPVTLAVVRRHSLFAVEVHTGKQSTLLNCPCYNIRKTHQSSGTDTDTAEVVYLYAAAKARVDNALPDCLHEVGNRKTSRHRHAAASKAPEPGSGSLRLAISMSANAGTTSRRRLTDPSPRSMPLRQISRSSPATNPTMSSSLTKAAPGASPSTVPKS